MGLVGSRADYGADAKRKIAEGLRALESELSTVEESIKEAEEEVAYRRE